MPCLNLSTNVNVDGVDTSSILKEATSTVAELVGKPEAVYSLSRCFIYVFIYQMLVAFRIFPFLDIYNFVLFDILYI